MKLGQLVHDPDDPYFAGPVAKIDKAGGVWVKVRGSLHRIARPRRGSAKYSGQQRHREIKGMRFRARQFGLKLHDYIEEMRP